MFPEQLLLGVMAPGRTPVCTGRHELEEPAAAWGEGAELPLVSHGGGVGKVPSKTPCRPDGGPARPPPSRGSENMVSASPQP